MVPRGEQEQLNALIADPTRRRTVLMGMRGCGKTQLAATLAKQCEDANWNLVAWINAVSPDTIQSDLVELAKRLKIDTSDQPAQDVIVRRCLDHLKSAVPTDRLIVFDNVEDINHLTGLIPSGDGVHVRNDDDEGRLGRPGVEQHQGRSIRSQRVDQLPPHGHEVRRS